MCLLANLHFLGLASRKADTDWLYAVLDQHPQLYLPSARSIHYWDLNYDQGNAWYIKHFAGSGDRLIGETTVDYAYMPDWKVREMSYDAPHVKLIFILRNPVECAWLDAISAMNRIGLKIHETSNQWFIDYFYSAASLARTDIQSIIRKYQRYFPPQQLLILRFDHLWLAPHRYLKQICQHLEIDPDFFQSFREEHLRPASDWVPIRPSLKPVLRRLYRERIDSFARSMRWRCGSLQEWHHVLRPYTKKNASDTSTDSVSPDLT